MTELSAAARLGVFGAGLAVVFAAALGVGRLTGDVADAEPVTPAPSAGHETDGDETGGHDTDGHDEGSGATPSAAAVSGTSLSDDGLRLDSTTTVLPADRPAEFAFQVRDEHGEPVTDYELEQGKRMHLVVVSRDLSRHAHVHPELGPDGTWRVPLTLPAGSYRAVADFVAQGERRSLAIDLAAPGTLAVSPLPPPSTTSSQSGLRVELDRDGEELTFTAYDAAGAPVTPEPYLGARGHLVAFRAGDLAYAHVHPSGEQGASTSYEAELPGPGTYRLFLELQVDGEVRTFPYTLEVTS